MSQSDWIEDVRSRLNMVEVVQPYTTLVARGRTWRGPCPLHQGTDPNFSVDPARGTYRCFVCDEYGDAFKFIMQVEGVQFMEAAKRLAAMVGVIVPDRAPRRRSPAALARGADQARMTSERGPWETLGLQAVALAGGGGVDPDGALTIPYGPLDAPDGWVRYRIIDGLPVRQGPPVQSLIWAPGARLHVHERPLVLVDEPIVAWRLSERGVSAVAVLDAQDGRALLDADQAQQIARSGVRSLVLGSLPSRGDMATWKTLFATEPVVLATGVEPLWSRPPQGINNTWEWAADDTLAGRLQDREATRPLFAWRVAHLAQAMRHGRMARNGLADKLSASLDAVVASGDRVRYQAYLAWAARELGVRERGALVVSPGAADADEF